MWYNPSNWQVTDGDGNPVANAANAILDLEKVPCQHDQVLFPKVCSLYLLFIIAFHNKKLYYISLLLFIILLIYLIEKI